MKTVYIDIKCSGNLTQNHAGIHGPFKDTFQCHIQLRFSKETTAQKRQNNGAKVHHNHCKDIGHI
jgi:hypothetical protein